jgi:hypothetical protein
MKRRNRVDWIHPIRDRPLAMNLVIAEMIC